MLTAEKIVVKVEPLDQTAPLTEDPNQKEEVEGKERVKEREKEEREERAKERAKERVKEKVKEKERAKEEREERVKEREREKVEETEERSKPSAIIECHPMDQFKKVTIKLSLLNFDILPQCINFSQQRDSLIDGISSNFWLDI